MRIIHQHPFGFYSGDDNESVCFWGLGDIKIELVDFSTPLKNFKEYRERNRLRNLETEKQLLEATRHLERRLRNLESEKQLLEAERLRYRLRNLETEKQLLEATRHLERRLRNLKTEKQLLEAERLRLEKLVNSLRNDKLP